VPEETKPGPQQEKRGRGRPPGTTKAKKVQRQLVRIMAAEGHERAAIADAVQVDEEMLTRDYAEELLTTKERLNAEVIAKLFETATKGQKAEAFRAQEFWVRCNAGWHEFAPRAYQPPLPAKPTAEPKPEKLGKKEQASLDAKNSPDQKSGWAKLVN
jgi:hypothetical protein